MPNSLRIIPLYKHISRKSTNMQGQETNINDHCGRSFSVCCVGVLSNNKISSKNRLLTLRLLMSYIYMEHLFLMFLDHTQRRTTVCKTPLGRVINSSQRPLPDNTRHSQQTYIHAPGGIRTHDLSR